MKSCQKHLRAEYEGVLPSEGEHLWPESALPMGLGERGKDRQLLSNLGKLSAQATHGRRTVGSHYIFSAEK